MKDLKDTMCWVELLQPIIDDFKDISFGEPDEPLDGDGVDSLVEIIKAKINLMQGNITEDEYYEAF